MSSLDGLSKREREVLTIVFSLGEATAHEVHASLGDGTSYSAVRTFLSTLEAKGRITHRLDGQTYRWFPAVDREQEGTTLMADTVKTFFKGSRERAIAALISIDERPLSNEEYRRLQALIEAARKRGR
jgi:predicted transcriptional regulator